MLLGGFEDGFLPSFGSVASIGLGLGGVGSLERVLPDPDECPMFTTR